MTNYVWTSPHKRVLRLASWRSLGCSDTKWIDFWIIIKNDVGDKPAPVKAPNCLLGEIRPWINESCIHSEYVVMLSWKHKGGKMLSQFKKKYIFLIWVLFWSSVWTGLLQWLCWDLLLQQNCHWTLSANRSWLAQFIKVWTEKHDSQTEQVHEKFTLQVNNPKRKRLKKKQMLEREGSVVLLAEGAVKLGWTYTEGLIREWGTGAQVGVGSRWRQTGLMAGGSMPGRFI